MNRSYRGSFAPSLLPALIFACRALPAGAETPGEIPKPWTYEGSMKLQEQQRQQERAQNCA